MIDHLICVDKPTAASTTIKDLSLSLSLATTMAVYCDQRHCVIINNEWLQRPPHLTPIKQKIAILCFLHYQGSLIYFEHFE